MIDPGDNLKIAMMIHGKSMNSEAGIKTAVRRRYHSSPPAVTPLLHLGKSDADSDDLDTVVMARIRAPDKALGDRLKVLYERCLKAGLADDITWDGGAMLAESIPHRSPDRRAAGPLPLPPLPLPRP